MHPIVHRQPTNQPTLEQQLQAPHGSAARIQRRILSKVPLLPLRHAALRKTHPPPLFECCFPYNVCPEPALVKQLIIFLSLKWHRKKRCVFRTTAKIPVAIGMSSSSSASDDVAASAHAFSRGETSTCSHRGSHHY
jgi:shikimate kinase